MKKELASKSAFFTPRVVISLAFCAVSVLVALLAFSLYSGGYAFAENPDASNNHGIAMSGIGFRTTTASVHSQARSGKNPIAEKYNTLVMRVYFRDRAERDRLAQELNAEEVPTTGGYLTVIRDRDLYYGLTARGLHVEIDENSSRNLSDPQILRETFYGGGQAGGGKKTLLPRRKGRDPHLSPRRENGHTCCCTH